MAATAVAQAVGRAIGGVGGPASAIGYPAGDEAGSQEEARITSARRHRMSADHLVIRPSSGRYTRWLPLRRLVVFLALAAVVLFVRQGLITGAVLFGIVVAFTASILGVTYLWIHRAHVVVTPEAIGKAGLTGRAKMRPRGDIGTLVVATTLDQGDAPGRAYKNLFVLDHSGRQIMRLRDVFWAAEDLDGVVERLGITPVEFEGIHSARQLAEKYPGASRGFERHPFRYTALFVVGFFGVIIVVVFGIELVKAITRAVG